MKTKQKKRKTEPDVPENLYLRGGLSKPLKAKKAKVKHSKFDDKSFFLRGTKEESFQNVLATKVKAGGKPKPKIPKMKRPSETEDVEENYIIVPWGSSDEWDAVCLDFHEANYDQVITKIGVWQKRVPALPVGVEATLFLLEAIVYDQKFLSKSQSSSSSVIEKEDQARSLYSLAIIRYLNHVSHLAAQSLGESSTRPTRELAALVDTPDWIVSLRNEISHGSTAPSIEVLRMAGAFVLQWLKKKYWKLPEVTSSTDSSDPLVISAPDTDEDVFLAIDEIMAAYIAARIYKLRHIYTIDDEEIIKHMHNPVNSIRIKTKTAMMTLRKKLKSYLHSHPSVFCAVFSQNIIPNAEFLESFSLTLRKNKEGLENDVYVFEKFYGIWLPIIKMLENKGKLLIILTNLCEMVINPELQRMWLVTARWINKILEIIECSGKKYANTLIKLLGIVIKHPNDVTQLFLERFFRLTKQRLGSDAVQKLNMLVSIWLEDNVETKKRRKQSAVKELFTLNDIEERGNKKSYCSNSCNSPQDSLSQNDSVMWQLDERGEDFWRNIPLGTIF